jgi:hypothetical protein
MVAMKYISRMPDEFAIVCPAKIIRTQGAGCPLKEKNTFNTAHNKPKQSAAVLTIRYRSESAQRRLSTREIQGLLDCRRRN